MILGPFADFERERISQRISEVKQQQKANGFWAGGQPPFGFRVNEEGRLEPNPEQAEALAAIHRWKSEGFSLRRISDKLDREFGIKLSFMSVKHAIAKTPAITLQKSTI